MRPGALERRGLGLRRPPGDQPEDRLLHHLRLRHDRSLQGLPEPRHRLRHLGRHRERRPSTTTASPTSPSTSSIGINAGPLFGALGDPGRRHPGAGDRRRRRPRARPVRRRGRHRLVPLARPGGPTSGPSPRSPATSPTTTSGARPAPPACARASATRSTRPDDGHVLFMASRAGVLEELLRGRRPRWTSSSAGRARSTPTTPGATASCRPSCATSSRTKTAPEWIDFGGEVNTPIAPVNTPKTLPTTRSSRTGSPLLTRRPSSAPTSCFPAALRRRGAAAPGQGADGRTAHRRRPALGARLRRRSDRHRPATGGHSGPTRKRRDRPEGEHDGQGPARRARAQATSRP